MSRSAPPFSREAQKNVGTPNRCSTDDTVPRMTRSRKPGESASSFKGRLTLLDANALSCGSSAWGDRETAAATTRDGNIVTPAFFRRTVGQQPFERKPALDTGVVGLATSDWPFP